MKHSFSVTSVFSRIKLPKMQLEKHVNRHHRTGTASQVAAILIPGYENVLWRFAHVPVNGNIEIEFTNNHSGRTTAVEIPVATGFLAGCTKANDGAFQFVVGISLS